MLGKREKALKMEGLWPLTTKHIKDTTTTTNVEIVLLVLLAFKIGKNLPPNKLVQFETKPFHILGYFINIESCYSGLYRSQAMGIILNDSY